MKNVITILVMMWFSIFLYFQCSKSSPPNSPEPATPIIPDEAGHIHIYASPSGNDNHTGANPSEAVKTINKAMEIVSNYRIEDKKFIHLAEGIYSKESNGEKFPVEVWPTTKIIGAGIGKTIIKGNKNQNSGEEWALFWVSSYCNKVHISRMTLIDAECAVLLGTVSEDTLSYLELDNNTDGIITTEGSAIAHHVTVKNSNYAMQVTEVWNCVLENNNIALSSRGGNYKNIIVANNQVGISVGGVMGYAGTIYAQNMVIAFNQIGLNCSSAASHYNSYKGSSIVNSIVWANEQPVVTACAEPEMSIFNCSFQFSYCDIPQLAQFEKCDDKTLFEGDGNFNADPLFSDPQNGNYRLLANSPCKNAGDPATKYLNQDGSRNDLGAFGGPLGSW